MSNLYLFNPENDLALAHGKSQYTAPPNALRLHIAGASLPLWFCHEGDFVFAPYVDDAWCRRVASKFDIKGNIVHDAHGLNVSSCIPWGWSPNAKRQFIDCGVDASLLPNDEQLNQIRELSHRRISIEVLSRIKELMPSLNVSIPCEAKCIDEVIMFAHCYSQFYVKSPWSSSGRGVINASLLSEEELRRRVMGIIRRQGSVMCEKSLDKVKDFAMLFYSDGTCVRFQGFSLFFNENNGAYAGNMIASQEEIFSVLNSYVPHVDIYELANKMQIILTDIVSNHYHGYLGVDMMIYQERGQCHVAPCVEVNLRMTMGAIAMLWSQRYLAECSSGVMRVEYKTTKTIDVPYESELIKFEGNKLKSGTISLIPPDEYFRMTISLTDGETKTF